MGVVTGLDITQDPAHGVDGTKLAEAIKLDPRVKYVIWNRQIYNPSISKTWRKYTGKNPHTHHVHVSVKPDKKVYDDTSAWVSGIEPGTGQVTPVTPAEPERQTVQLGSQGGDVFSLQRRLGLTVDGDFGPKTDKAVKAFQKAEGLIVDGIVGPYTWEALDKKTAATPRASVPETLISTPPPEVKDAHWVVQELRKRGYSRLDAIVYAANLVWESGAKGDDIVWNARGDKGSDGMFHSHGAAQWNDRHGRYDALLKLAEMRGVPWTDPDAQIEHLTNELSSTEAGVRTNVETATTLQDKMAEAIKFWRPSIPHADRRLKIAERLDKEISDDPG